MFKKGSHIPLITGIAQFSDGPPNKAESQLNLEGMKAAVF